MDPDLRAAAVLASARTHRAEADAAERAKLEDAITWAALHEVEDGDSSYAAWENTPLPITGEGAPLINHYCIAEFAAALGMRTGSGRQYLADAVELAHRLPDLLARVRAGKVPVFKARRIAQLTNDLPLSGAGYVDHHLNLAAGRVSLAQIERLVVEARILFDPARAAEEAAKAAEERHVFINTRHVTLGGNMSLEATLDLADALDLEDAVNLLGKQIQQLHPEQSWDVCRAKALGALARGELANLPQFPLRALDPDTPLLATRARNLNLFVHLRSDGTDSTGLEPQVLLENGKRLLLVDQIKAWAGEATKVIIRPVIDLHHNISVTGYEIPDRIAEHVALRDRRCVFPFCERRAMACDNDHTTPYDEAGPPGQTATDNLAPLCRHHHVLKTHHDWHYVAIEPGVYQWRSPHGLAYLTDPTGTRELTPEPVPPPRMDAPA